jgi:hypothetical protein
MNTKEHIGSNRLLCGCLLLALCTPVNGVAQTAGERASTQSLGIWSARWWQWALEKTVATSPLFGPSADYPARQYCESSGLDSVWFLGGTLGFEGPLVRECTVPAGTRLFFPVANMFFVRDQFLVAEYGRWPLKWSKEKTTAGMDNVSELIAKVDGVAITNLPTYRVKSPAFTINFPPGHIYEQYGYPAGLYTPATSDGIWLMLPPLSPGKHTVYFHAAFPTGEVIDVTYSIFAVV